MKPIDYVMMCKNCKEIDTIGKNRHMCEISEKLSVGDQPCSTSDWNRCKYNQGRHWKGKEYIKITED